MKTKLVLLACLFLAVVAAEAKKYPQIKFEKTLVDLGSFSMEDPVRTCTFAFKNVGEAKLVITTVHTTCGCTVADYPKDFIAPGGTGVIKVTYDGSNKMPGRFKKNIQVFSNCKEDMARLYIQGFMSDVPVSKKAPKE